MGFLKFSFFFFFGFYGWSLKKRAFPFGSGAFFMLQGLLHLYSFVYLLIWDRTAGRWSENTIASFPLSIRLMEGFSFFSFFFFHFFHSPSFWTLEGYQHNMGFTFNPR